MHKIASFVSFKENISTDWLEAAFLNYARVCESRTFSK